MLPARPWCKFSAAGLQAEVKVVIVEILTTWVSVLGGCLESKIASLIVSRETLSVQSNPHLDENVALASYFVS